MKAWSSESDAVEVVGVVVCVAVAIGVYTVAVGTGVTDLTVNRLSTLVLKVSTVL